MCQTWKTLTPQQWQSEAISFTTYSKFQNKIWGIIFSKYLLHSGEIVTNLHVSFLKLPNKWSNVIKMGLMNELE
jgi:hypothetical protein